MVGDGTLGSLLDLDRGTLHPVECGPGGPGPRGEVFSRTGDWLDLDRGKLDGDRVDWDQRTNGQWSEQEAMGLMMRGE